MSPLTIVLFVLAITATVTLVAVALNEVLDARRSDR